jgi:cytochrome b involved in lipid metabolism
MLDTSTSEEDGQVMEETPGEGGGTMSYNMEEISEHASAEDCWLLIEGKVYDVTEFVNGHPGGKAILEGCGMDATELYKTRPMGSGTEHSEEARSLLDEYLIGELVTGE